MQPSTLLAGRKREHQPNEATLDGKRIHLEGRSRERGGNLHPVDSPPASVESQTEGDGVFKAL